MSKKITKRQRNNSILLTHNEYVAQARMILKAVEPLTEAQAKLVKLYNSDYDCIAAIGSAGTGKSYMALSLALEDVVMSKNYEKVIIIRSSVQTRDQGFMPGTLEEKMSYFEGPYIDIVADLTGKKDGYKQLKDREKIQFMSSTFVRGLTFDNAIVIVDEAQSMNAHELKSICQRVGQNTRLILCGDTKQDDLYVAGKNRLDKSGLTEVLNILGRVESFNMVRFTKEDIVRSGFVKEFLIAEEELEAA